MIQVVDGLPDGLVGFQASGKLTAQDYTDVLAPSLEAAGAGGGRIRVLLEFAGEFDGIEAGAVWQDMRMGMREWSAWERIALVTDHAWMRDGLSMFAWAVPGEVRAFPSAERDAAITWLQGH
jgi:SpoIIAA-like